MCIIPFSCHKESAVSISSSWYKGNREVESPFNVAQNLLALKLNLILLRHDLFQKILLVCSLNHSFFLATKQKIFFLRNYFANGNLVSW